MRFVPGRCPECKHPLTAHTDTEQTFPYAICARAVVGSMIGGKAQYTRCGCRLWCGIEVPSDGQGTSQA